MSKCCEKHLVLNTKNKYILKNLAIKHGWEIQLPKMAFLRPPNIASSKNLGHICHMPSWPSKRVWFSKNRFVHFQVFCCALSIKWVLARNVGLRLLLVLETTKISRFHQETFLGPPLWFRTTRLLLFKIFDITHKNKCHASYLEGYNYRGQHLEKFMKMGW